MLKFYVPIWFTFAVPVTEVIRNLITWISTIAFSGKAGVLKLVHETLKLKNETLAKIWGSILLYSKYVLLFQWPRYWMYFRCQQKLQLWQPLIKNCTLQSYVSAGKLALVSWADTNVDYKKLWEFLTFYKTPVQHERQGKYHTIFVPLVNLTFGKVEAFGKIEILVAMCNFNKIACDTLLSWRLLVNLNQGAFAVVCKNES